MTFLQAPRAAAPRREGRRRRRRAARCGPRTSPTASTRGGATWASITGSTAAGARASRRRRSRGPPGRTRGSIATAPAAHTRRQRSRTCDGARRRRRGAARSSASKSSRSHRASALSAKPGVGRQMPGSAQLEASASTQPMPPQVHGRPSKSATRCPPRTPAWKCLPAEEPSPDHRRAADAGPERHHHDVAGALRRPGVALAEQRQARVVLDPERQAEGPPTPPGQVQPRGVVVLGVGGEHPARHGVHQAAEAEREPGAGRHGNACRGGRPSQRSAQSPGALACEAGRGLERHASRPRPPRDRPRRRRRRGCRRGPRPGPSRPHLPLRAPAHHDRSISSRLRPFVSGITRQMKRRLSDAHRRVEPEGADRADRLDERQEGGGHQDAGEPQARGSRSTSPAPGSAWGTAPRSPPRRRDRGPRRTRPRRAGSPPGP